MNLYPPLLGAGIRVIPGGDDGLDFTIRMKLTVWNRNYLGTHYGGSLYSLCDPFFLLILIERLGPGYIVWDKEATVRFVRPGRGTVEARFVLTREQIEEVRARAERQDVVEPRYQVEVRDTQGRTVAAVEKLLYVRKKRPPSRDDGA